MSVKKTTSSFLIVDSISALHRLIGLPKPTHPLLSVVDCQALIETMGETVRYLNNFYIISVKKDFKGKLKYGQQHYDFDEGVMSFLAPGQLIANTITQDQLGVSVIFHPDLIRGYPLERTIKKYGYFAYTVSEALHLSEEEETMTLALMRAIESEYRRSIDAFTQPVLVAQLDLLLTYCDRFYNRQFITRKLASNDLLVKLEALLDDCFDGQSLAENGPPTVQFVSNRLNVSPTYLSDTLRSLTGQNTQQHIHAKLISKAKELLTSTSLSVSEIAYQLGFDYPQSFNKLFKKKTSVSPLNFRESFN